ncbi:MAG TPA: 50S ribosomal protein P1 [Nitrososphaerales archaeon]|nr:50S ribosomal protein P1 [Nitrososphaerales archaeon]
MEYVYAALLLHKLNQPVNEENVKKVVSAAGVNPDEIRVKALVSALGEINIDDALKSAAAAPVVAAAPAAGAAQAPAVAAGKPKEEEAKEEEKKEEQALEGLSSLFG